MQFIGRFQDAALKYQHAQRHFATLVGLINGLLGETWWRPEKVEGGADGTVRVNILRHPTPEWSLILGDFVHNLRGCLDYATCGVVEAGNPEANLSNIQFPFGRPGQRLSSDERKRVKGIPPHALERIEAIRAEFSADLNFVNLMSNQDKHRLLLPVAVRQVPVKLTIDHASNTGSIDVDIAGAMDVWTREIHDGDVIEMPKVGLMLGPGLLIEDQPMPFPLKYLERLNLSVQKAFMAMALIERNAPVLNVAEI